MPPRIRPNCNFKRLPRWAWALVFGACSTVGVAQTDSIVLEEVHVYEDLHSAQLLEILPDQRLYLDDRAFSISESLSALLRNEPGLAVRSAGGNIEVPVIHGLFGNRIAVLNNGLKHSFQNWGLDHAPEIDYFNAHSIRVIKGAAGVKYGLEAMGGALLVEGNPLLINHPLYGHVEIGGMSNGWGYRSALELGYGGKNWSAFANGKISQRGDQRTPDYVLTNTGKKEAAWNAGLRFYSGGAWDFKVNYKFIQQNLGFLRASVFESASGLIAAMEAKEPLLIEPFSYAIHNPLQITSHHLASAESMWFRRPDQKITFTAGYQLNHRREMDVRRNAEKPIIDLTLRSAHLQSNWEFRRNNYDKTELGAGVTLFDNDNNPGTGTTAYIPNYNTQQFHFFALDHRHLEKGVLELGIRFDAEQNDVRGRQTNQDVFRDQYAFGNVTASAGYSMSVFKSNGKYSVHVGSAWRAPNMAELYSFGQHGFKSVYGLLRYNWKDDGTLATDRVTTLENSDVQIEKGYKFIQELVIPSSRGVVSANLYTHFINDYIFQKPAGFTGTVRGPLPVFIYTQTDALLSGVDVKWEHTLAHDLEGILGLSYLHGVNLRTGGPLLHQPPMTVQWELDWAVGKRHRTAIRLSPKYTFQPFFAPEGIDLTQWMEAPESFDSQNEIYDFRSPPPGYFTLDLSSEITLNKFKIQLAARNILNNPYRNYLNEMRYFADEPGIDISINVRYYLNLIKP